MKKLFFVFILIISCYAFAHAQNSKPLTQAEYVKMLYAVEANPANKDVLIQAIRKRGLGFELTSGLRSLTTSKSRNDAELKRTLEEANRRRENPEASQLPSPEEAQKLIENTRQNTLAAVEEMPDFVVKQRIRRAIAYAGTNNFRGLDRLIVAVSYLSRGQEEYKVLSINGVRQQNPEAKKDYTEVRGTSSTGEFVSVLAKVFKRDSDTEFEIVDTDTIRGRRAVVFSYQIEKAKAQQGLTAVGYISDSTITGVKGRVWIDRENFRVLRLENIATQIPDGFPIRSAQRVIDYEWVKINDEPYLLPSLSDVRLTFNQNRKLFETRNLIHFKDYQKYGSEVIILDDDDEEIPETVDSNEVTEETTDSKP